MRYEERRKFYGSVFAFPHPENFSTSSQSNPMDKPARLRNCQNQPKKLEMLRRQCCLRSSSISFASLWKLKKEAHASAHGHGFDVIVPKNGKIAWLGWLLAFGSSLFCSELIIISQPVFFIEHEGKKSIHICIPILLVQFQFNSWSTLLLLSMQDHLTVCKLCSLATFFPVCPSP